MLADLAEAERLLCRVGAARSMMLATAQERALASVEGQPQQAQELAIRSAAAEIAAVLRRSEATVIHRMNAAHSLVLRFPSVHRAWAEGLIHEQHALIIEQFGAPIECPDRRDAYTAAALEAACELNPKRLRVVARRLAEEARELPLDERHERAMKERRVWVEDLDDGMSCLSALLPTTMAHAILDRLDRHVRALREPGAAPPEEWTQRRDSPSSSAETGELAQSARTDELARAAGSDELARAAGSDERGSSAASSSALVLGERESGDGRSSDVADPRSRGEMMADSLMDLLLTSDAAQIVQRPDGGAPRLDARIALTVPVLSLLGESMEPARLLGVSPIPLGEARQLASEAPGLTRILTDPITNAPVAVDRRLPTRQIRETLAVRDARCRFPGCHRPPTRCDVDHTIDVAKGGRTSMDNLAHLCRWHHVLKHQSAWKVRQLADGVLEWTTPTGIVIADRPDHQMPRFTPDDPGSPPDDPGSPADDAGGSAHPPGARPSGSHCRDGETGDSAAAPPGADGIPGDGRESCEEPPPF